MILYCFVFFLLLNGVVSVSGSEYVDEMFLFLGTLILTYIFFFFIKKKINKKSDDISFLKKIQLSEKSVQILAFLSLFCFIICMKI